MPEPRARRRAADIWRAVAFITASLLVHVTFWWLAPKFRSPRPTPPKPERIDVRVMEVPPPKKPDANQPEKQPKEKPKPELVQKVPPPKRTPEPKEKPQQMRAFEPNPQKEQHTLAPDAPKVTQQDSRAPNPGSDAAAGGTPTGRPSGGSENGGASGPVDPGQVRLFDPNAFGRAMDHYNSQQPKTGQFMAAHGGDDSNDPLAEQARVGGRMAAGIQDAQTEGRVAGGLISSCNDGIDQGADGYMDCADPGCRMMPACQNTLEYANRESGPIPDDSAAGVTTIIDVPDHGTIRTISIRVDISHASPGDIALEMEHLPSGKKMTIRLADRSNRVLPKAFLLRDFIGTESAGRWILHVRDVLPSYTGKLRGWHLYITR